MKTEWNAKYIYLFFPLLPPEACFKGWERKGKYWKEFSALPRCILFSMQLKIRKIWLREDRINIFIMLNVKILSNKWVQYIWVSLWRKRRKQRFSLFFYGNNIAVDPNAPTGQQQPAQGSALGKGHVRRTRWKCKSTTRCRCCFQCFCPCRALPCCILLTQGDALGYERVGLSGRSLSERVNCYIIALIFVNVTITFWRCQVLRVSRSDDIPERLRCHVWQGQRAWVRVFSLHIPHSSWFLP